MLVVQDGDMIQDFFSLIEFESFSSITVSSVKMPGEFEFVMPGVITQRLQLVSREYLRSPNGLLRGDVKLTKESSVQILEWLRVRGATVSHNSYQE